MKFHFQSRNSQQLLYSIIIFAVTFCTLAFAVDQIWFREDDLGTILNGIIRSCADFVRVFSADCRSFITPANYQRTAPNMISGFLRPMQNALFSVIYPIWNVNPWAYYYVHVALHAANAVLLFLTCSRFMALWLSALAGLMFAFYPDVAWLTWIGTVQNSLAVLFLLLSVMLWVRSCLVFSGFMYLLSLLSRETAILLPLWFFLAGFLFAQNQQFFQRVRLAISYSWIFFLANGIYTAMRFWAFGLGTLPRTVRNLTLRFPWLAQYLNTSSVVQKAISQAPVHAVPTQAISSISDATVQSSSWLHGFYTSCIAKYISWFEAFFNIQFPIHWAFFAVVSSTLFLVIFLVLAYRGQQRILFWLCFGLLCVSWPGVLAYPSPRYINMVYPFLIVIVLYGVFLAFRQYSILLRAASIFILCCAILLTLRGLISNRSNLRSAAVDRFIYKQRFDDFFARYTFDPDTRFILVSSPFVSDIQSIFQAYMNNLETIVVFDPFATYAEFGVMGCRKEYRVTGVTSSVVPITRGFRLISHDREHCGWWLRFSDHPIAWVESTRSYEWTNQNYQAGRWYPCSIGKFRINDLVDQDCVADIEFVFDERWISEQCVFVAWDSQMGRYILLKSG